MSIADFTLILGSFCTGGGFVILLVLIVLNSPQVLVTGWQLLAKGLYWLRLNNKRKIIGANIEYQINVAVARFRKEVPSAFPETVQVNWITNQDGFAKLNNGDVVLYINDSPNQAKVLVDSTILFLREAVLSESRPYIDRKILEAINLTLARSMFERDQAALSYFHNNFMQSIELDDMTSNLYNLSERLHDYGVLTRIVMLEYGDLAIRLRGRDSTSRIREESIRFARFVESVVSRESRDTNLRFMGKHFSTTVALVADPVIASTMGLELYGRKFKLDIENGTKVIHLLARGRNNVQLARYVARNASENKYVSSILPRTYYESGTSGELIPAICITCYSNKFADQYSLSPVDEVYSILAEVVPEILLGRLEVLAIAREKGVRTKIVVKAIDSQTSIGVFVGPNGSNITRIKALLASDEEIDIVGWKPSLEELIIDALYPLRRSEIVSMKIVEAEMLAVVQVSKDDIVGIAVGKRGINVQLAERVTGCRIQIVAVDSTVKSDEYHIESIMKRVTQVSDKFRLKSFQRIENEVIKVVLESTDEKLDCSFLLKSESIISLIDDCIEEIQFIDWSADPQKLVANSLFPLKSQEIIRIVFSGNYSNNCRVFVKSNEAKRIAVGKGGINVKLAEKVTDKKLTIIVDNMT